MKQALLMFVVTLSACGRHGEGSDSGDQKSTASMTQQDADDIDTAFCARDNACGTRGSDCDVHLFTDGGYVQYSKRFANAVLACIEEEGRCNDALDACLDDSAEMLPSTGAREACLGVRGTRCPDIRYANCDYIEALVPARLALMNGCLALDCDQIDDCAQNAGIPF